MPKIRALMSSAERKAGDEWDATEIEARLLCAPDLPGGQRAEYVDRAMRPVEPAPTQVQSMSIPEKRRYMRRDLQARD